MLHTVLNKRIISTRHYDTHFGNVKGYILSNSESHNHFIIVLFVFVRVTG